MSTDTFYNKLNSDFSIFEINYIDSSRNEFGFYES